MATTSAAASVTALLESYRQGDHRALESLISLVYPELRRIAAAQMRRERAGQTLQPTALVHEALARMIASKMVPWRNRAHLMAAAAKVMRWVLLDRAKGRGRAKRGGKAIRITFDEERFRGSGGGVEVVALDQALRRLARQDPRGAQIVELKFFGGLTFEEISRVLEISPTTARRDWALARAWLFRELADSK